MTDKQTALLLRAVRDRANAIRDALPYWSQENPEVSGKEAMEKADDIIYVRLILKLDEDIELLES